MLNPHPTRYAELNGVLHDLVTGAQAALGDDFVGAYLQGSFALGAGDLHSDCDFLVVVRRRPDARQEAALRALHRDLPHRDGFWNRHLEGSYAVADDLRSVAGLGRAWLYVDHGSDEMEWSEHCNQPWTRWIVREHGITLVGPCPVQLMDPVPDDVLREQARGTPGHAEPTTSRPGARRRWRGASATSSCRRAAASTPCAPGRWPASATPCAGR